MKIPSLLLAAGAIALLGAAPDDAATAKRAQEALLPLKKELMGALQAAIAEGGPVAAINVCRLKAPEIAARASAAPGIALGRTSHRLRNPDNAPEPWMKPLLERYVGKMPDEVPPHVVVHLPEGQGKGYVEPIYTAGLCLTCHGQALAPEVTAKLDELYPKDVARGFAPGEFRGLFWVKLTEPEGGPAK